MSYRSADYGLGSLLPAVSFIAKSEIARWPLFGLLAKLQKSLFVQRTTGQTARQLRDMRARFHNGDTLILFAEGTSGDERGCCRLSHRCLALSTCWMTSRWWCNRGYQLCGVQRYSRWP
jgi:1-acyl-sn-glycerol-3-phosphate acyltransferase